MNYRSLVLSMFFMIFVFLNTQCNSLSEPTSAEITINTETTIDIKAGNVVKPVELKFGTGVGAIGRSVGWPSTGLNDQKLIDAINELKLDYINLSATSSPFPADLVVGRPFFPENTGEFENRMNYFEWITKMGINEESTGGEGDYYRLITSTDTSLIQDPQFIQGELRDTPKKLFETIPNKNYDDVLQFFEKLDKPPKLFIRVPTFFFSYMMEPLPHTAIDGRAEVMIDIDPKTGADFVHYLNDPPTTELGALRAKNGHPEPYNVKYFMLGNELYWPYEDFGLSADRIVSQTIKFARAMKEADPTIKIVFNPAVDGFPESWYNDENPTIKEQIEKYLEFNREIAPRIKEDVDAVQFFSYSLGYIGEGEHALPIIDKEGWKAIMAQVYLQEKNNMAGRLRNVTQTFGGDNAGLIFGEFGGAASRLGGAIYDADFTIHLLKNDYDVFAGTWDLGVFDNNYFTMIYIDPENQEQLVKRPSFYTQKLFGSYFGDTIVEANIFASPTFDIEEYDELTHQLIIPATTGIPSLNTIATTKDDKLYLMVVNRDLDRDITTNIQLDFSPESKANVYTLNGPAICATNEPDPGAIVTTIKEGVDPDYCSPKDYAPGQVTITDSTIDNASASFSYTFEKHSVTAIVFDGLTTGTDIYVPMVANEVSPTPTNSHATSEPDPAPIPAIRQGNFKIRVVDENGTAVPQADIAIHQTGHEFIFGGQIPFWLIDPAYADQGDQTAVLQYANTMFEQVIPSQITWGWVEPEHGVLDFSRYDLAAGWAREQGKRTLAQHIFWGLYDETHERNPAWLDELSQDEFEAALYQRITAVQANVGQIDGIVVLNEAMYRNVYNDRMGYDITPDLFAAARAAFPDADLYINENPWQAIDLGLVPPGDLQTPMDNYIAYVRQLDQNGVDFDKVGLQVYLSQSDVEAFGGIEPFVAEVDALLNRFAAETGRPIIITEYGLSAPDHAFRAAFLAAFMQMVFANPHVEGFQLFHWLDEQLPDNALVRVDGSLTPAGETYLRLKGEWTTRLEGQTGGQGEIAFTGAYGVYEVVVTTGRQAQTFILDLSSSTPREATLTISP